MRLSKTSSSFRRNSTLKLRSELRYRPALKIRQASLHLALKFSVYFRVLSSALLRSPTIALIPPAAELDSSCESERESAALKVDSSTFVSPPIQLVAFTG